MFHVTSVSLIVTTYFSRSVPYYPRPRVLFTMIGLLAFHVVQHGPNGAATGAQRYLWLLVLVPVLLLVVVLYRLFLPALHKVSVSENLSDLVAKTAAAPETVVLPDGAVDDVSETPERSAEAPLVVARRLLESEERRVVDALVKAGGSLLQKEISWETGFSRVKTHRILVRLLRRGVVTSEKYYNTNRITLADWLRDPASRNE